MSRIGIKPIQIPEGVELNIGKNNHVTVKGPKGEMSLDVHPDLVLKQEDGEVSVERPTEQKRHKEAHGLYRSLLNNLVDGVHTGYKRTLDLIGVGYKAEVKGDVLQINIGYSHDIYFKMPPEIKATAEMVKGQPPRVTLESSDKQLVGEVATKLRSLRPPEPYKGKGVRYTDEYVRKKLGKAAAKK